MVTAVPLGKGPTLLPSKDLTKGMIITVCVEEGRLLRTCRLGHDGEHIFFY